ncbi:DNA polymerase III subunit alpha [Micractinium conductrix]|uniref:DNA polymerase III subunit alpha n=1 Tax=Micractinium conductrix TaxID=554055 RepID=A0A2P6V6L0_9CHLO|nr:DNA polymerase III subunit alpha [Micractinium conductrix]|eukprot:PSC69726.1 DNA polymerase III subunit alpha [Micractinium conductrix]
MAGEVVGAGGRIKFTVERTGELRLPAPPPAPLEQLADLMQRLEACGMVPILDDGLPSGMRGLEAARAAGLPISDRATLFSTPDDLEALEALFRSHPYPHHRCYIRRGHGFLLLTQSVAEAAAYVERHIAPLLTPPAADRGSGGERAGDGSGAVPPRAAARQAAADGDGAEQAAADGGGMR